MAPDTIVVTGFGPFGEYQVNSSWEAVKLLPPIISDYKVIKEEIPVSYGVVDESIRDLWKQHKPRLVVHVGVSHLADCITLENCAYKNGYLKPDIHGNFPMQGKVCGVECSDDIIKAGLNVEEICLRLNSDLSTKTYLSENAGRYLCEYIFYTSLAQDRNRSLFVHVPTLNSPYTAEELAHGLEQVIVCALKQIEDKEANDIITNQIPDKV